MKVNDLKEKNSIGINSLVLFVTFAVFMSFFTAISGNSAALPDTTILHLNDPVFTKDNSLPIQIRVDDSLPVVAVRCYFRFQDTSPYVYVDLTASENDMFMGTLPPPAKEVSSMEYFFLVVNDRHQVVRSKSYLLNSGNNKDVSEILEEGDVSYVLKTELSEIPAEVANSFFDPEQVAIEKTADDERFGLVGGVYTAADFPDAAMTEGYYGGFVIGESGELFPVKGLIYGWPEQNVTAGRSLQMAEPLLFPEATDPVISDIIGPDIQGDDWTGITYLMDGHGVTYYEARVSAVVTHVNDQVTITLTYIDYSMWPISEYFWGCMTESGDMTLYDELEPPETWTTFFGPATETSITIADYTDHYDPEENPYPDLYVVELSRDPAPPPPPPEPDLPSFLSAIYKLLLF